MESSECPSSISIIGSGEMSRALAIRLHGNGFDVNVGSRYPSEIKDVPSQDIMGNVKVTPVADCIQASSVIVLAIHPEHHDTLRRFEPLMAGKILVDCSNADDDDSWRCMKRKKKAGFPSKSNAEALAALLPKSRVVKAFNTVSAAALEAVYEPLVTYVCGEDRDARDTVSQLAGRLGLTAVDAGGLGAAGRLEAYNRRLLPDWTRPTAITAGVTAVWLVYTLCRHYVLRRDPYTWDMFPTYVLNKTISVIAVTLLALVYLAGALAACVQFVRGTKRTRFHWTLDAWLRMRRQLGLYALLFAAIHGAMSVALLSPTYYTSWFHFSRVTISANSSGEVVVAVGSKMNWIGETCVLLGILTLVLMTVVGITSINSIASSLTQREWRVLQSHVGLACLALAVGHTTVKGAPRWSGESWATVLQGITFLGSLIPWLTLALRLMLLTPCVYGRVRQIRRGGERRIHDGVESGGSNGSVNNDVRKEDHCRPDVGVELEPLAPGDGQNTKPRYLDR